MFKQFSFTPHMLTILQFLAGLIGASQATSYTGLMVARVFHGFGRSAPHNSEIKSID
jgi:hypothetical protein